MPLELSALNDLLVGKPHTAFVAHVPEEVSEYFGCKLGRVSLSTDSLKHIMEKHPVDMTELLHLPFLVKRGLWVAEHDKPMQACVLYQVPEEEIRYKAAMKLTRDLCEIYVSTFHRAKKRQTRAVLKRGKILRNHL